MRRLVFGLALCALAGGASATGSFSTALNGSGYTAFNYYDPRCNPQVYGCDPAGQNFYWVGNVNATLSGSSDGIYSGASVLSFEVDIEYAGDSYPFISYNTDGSGVNSYYYYTPVSLTVLNGKIASISTNYWSTPYTDISFNGAQVLFEDGLDDFGNPAHHASITTGNGFLGPIPEPSTYALMLAGIAAVGLRLKKRASA